jgi:hypothetical protein
MTKFADDLLMTYKTAAATKFLLIMLLIHTACHPAASVNFSICKTFQKTEKSVKQST